MQMERVVSEKGQIVIPKDARDFVGIKPGSMVVIEVQGGGIVIRPQKTGKEFVDYFCKTSRKLKRSPTSKELKRTMEEQYDLP
ncbi:MAG: AbrB/MazE/SpoVT family DNA-binding domain-containing protein [Candidatus Aenigmarchaeota archaeon]|nr:AbrB/MazE/SpoVT family DNA-binding domain-containing protein [Candidatus Aenigmarchaeota archaeon]